MKFEMQKIVNAEKSDLFDVLAHVAYALPPVTREKRANRAKIAIQPTFNSRQQAFAEPIRYSPQLTASLSDLIQSVKAQGLEGLVAKRADSKYEPGERSGA
jgi:type I restriction enzyme R subunit